MKKDNYSFNIDNLTSRHTSHMVRLQLFPSCFFKTTSTSSKHIAHEVISSLVDMPFRHGSVSLNASLPHSDVDVYASGGSVSSNAYIDRFVSLACLNDTLSSLKNKKLIDYIK